MADRFSRRYTICGSLFVWSAVTWATGHVTTYNGLLLARSLMGISEAFYIPAALALIADYHAGHTRSRAVGLHQMASYVGVIVGGFSGYVADGPTLGWRLAFDTCGIAGVLYAVPLALLVRESRTYSNTASVAAARNSVVDSAKELLGNGSFILLVLYFTLPAIAGWVVRDWMPAILRQQFEIGQGPAGIAATSSWQMAAILGAVFGGWLADRWMRRNVRGRIFASAIGMGFIIPALFGVGNAGTLAIAITFLADGSLNLGAVEKPAAHFLKHNLTTVLVAGTPGECDSLTFDERRALAQRWSEVMRGTPLKLVFHVGSNCLEDCRLFAAQAQAIGASAISAFAPSYFKPPNLDTLVAWCAGIASAAPGIPFYFYDIPGLTGVSFPMLDFLAQGSTCIPTLAGLKFTNPDLMAYQFVLRAD